MTEFPIDELQILKRKDSHPYEWVDSYERFNYEELPPKECFFSSVNDDKRDRGNSNILDEQYLHLKMYAKNLILTHLGIFTIITYKKMYYY